MIHPLRPHACSRLQNLNSEGSELPLPEFNPLVIAFRQALASKRIEPPPSGRARYCLGAKVHHWTNSTQDFAPRNLASYQYG